MKLYSNYYYIGSIHHVVSVLSGACRWPLPEDGGGVKRMLDIGCGPGNSTAVLRERYPHAEILGVDSSPDMIEAARKAYPDIDFQLCDVSARLDELPADFDVVFSNACIQWVPDHPHLIPGLLARLRVGGSAGCADADEL